MSDRFTLRSEPIVIGEGKVGPEIPGMAGFGGGGVDALPRTSTAYGAISTQARSGNTYSWVAAW